MIPQMETNFLDAVVQGLIHEENELRDLFAKNGDRYCKQHNGITCLYETTMVYITMKQLLRTKFPLTVSWEHPYPNHPGWKADLGLLNEDQSIDSLVEFKLWWSEDGNEICGDIEKFKESSFQGGRYICVIELLGGNIKDNCQYLQKNPDIEVIDKRAFSTYAFLQKKQTLGYAPVNVYLLKVTK